jgi:hypothetical protein
MVAGYTWHDMRHMRAGVVNGEYKYDYYAGPDGMQVRVPHLKNNNEAKKMAFEKWRSLH